jgi:arylsulfatase A-like enzyme
MNLLVIVADTFRADYLGCYGNGWIKTPRLDRLAAEGVRFEDCYAEGLPTLPDRRVLYTGRRVFPFKIVKQKSDMVAALPGWHPLFYEDVTMAEWLSEHGYTTGLISDVYHQFKPGKNYHRGFHSWQWIRGQEADPTVPTPKPDVDVSHYCPPKAADPLRRLTAQYLNNRCWWKGEADHYAAQVMRAAAQWLKDYGRKRPWMLWVESFDPHEPWDAPKEFADMYCPNYSGRELLFSPGVVSACSADEFRRIKANYAGECSHVDKWCGHVLDTLDEIGQRDDTLVVFTSDHGCMMGEQGQIHKGEDRLRIQVCRTPLLIRHPDRAFAGKVVKGFVQHHDLMPTLLKPMDLPAPDRCNGEDFWPMVTGERAGGLRREVIGGFGRYGFVRTAEWNYQAAWFNRDAPHTTKPQLYDRRSDPEELVNVIEKHPDVAKDLDAKLAEVVKEAEATSGVTDAGEAPAAIPGLKW